MSDEGMSDAEFDAKVGFPVGERYVPKSKLDAAEARATAAERDRDALREIAVDVSTMKGQDGELSPIARKARAALTANHSAPVVEE